MNQLLISALLFLITAAAYGQGDPRMIPLTDMGRASYYGFGGGLYPDGTNTPPAAHFEAGMRIAEQIIPLDLQGEPDPESGRIVLLSIGMSNTTQEFRAFVDLVSSEKSGDVNPSLTLVDGAQGGQTANDISDPEAVFWSRVDQRLVESGVSAPQVRMVWLKEANRQPSGAFPGHADTLSSELEEIVRILKSRFPNLGIVFLSSRTFGGYATTTLNPEPYAYESGFSVKWLVERQIEGEPGLRYSGLDAPAVWTAWGPYLWANGTEPRSDGLVWLRDDFGNDGTHPSASGRRKVAELLWDFFSNDPVAGPVFIGKASAVEDQAMRHELDLSAVGESGE